MNSRQIRIIQDLESSQYPITSAALAKKYNVSLRTIRNDVAVIDEYLSQIEGAVFIKKAHYGLKINSKKSIGAMLQQESSVKDFVYLNESERHVLILLAFILGRQPITLDYLCEFFDVSKGTIVADVNSLRDWLQDSKIRLKGVKNKGFYLDGTTFDILSKIYLCFSTMDVTNFSSLLFSGDSSFFDEEEMEKINRFDAFLEKELNCSFINRFMVNLWAGYIFKRSVNAPEKNNETSIILMLGDKMVRLLEYFRSGYGINLNSEELSIAQFVLINYSDFHEDTMHSQDVSIVVDRMLEIVSRSYPEIQRDYDTLKIDLVQHVQNLLDRRKVNLPNNNPLLSQIKARYFDVFSVAKQAATVFENNFNMELSDDEIGFITLYYCRSLEKSKQMNEAKVMVVCNTGRGAAKLLTTRIMNSFPELHIMAMCSFDEIPYRTDLLELVDLVISTIPIKDIAKPCVVVSPFLSELELLKISEAIWIARRNDEKSTGEDLEKSASVSISRFTSEAVQQSETMLNAPLSFDAAFSNPDFNNEIYAEIIVQATDMLFKAFPGGLSTERFNIVAGVLAHIMMAIPRWKRGSFLQGGDFEELKKKYRYEYEIIMEFIADCEKILGIFIDPNESVAILRYLTY